MLFSDVIFGVVNKRTMYLHSLQDCCGHGHISACQLFPVYGDAMSNTSSTQFSALRCFVRLLHDYRHTNGIRSTQFLVSVLYQTLYSFLEFEIASAFGSAKSTLLALPAPTRNLS